MTFAAFEYFEKAAKQGHAEAQLEVGHAFRDNRGLKAKWGFSKTEHQKIAAKCYSKSANQGNAEAQHQLGLCYLNGDGVNKDEKLALQYLQLAVNQNNAAAIAKMAELTKENPVVINYTKALIAYDKADFKTTIATCQSALHHSPTDKPTLILLAVAAMRSDTKLTVEEIDAIKEYKKEIFDEIKKLPYNEITNKDEPQNKILLAAFHNDNIAGTIFHASRHTWMPDFFGGGKCEPDSGTLKDIAEELVTRNLLRKMENSVLGAAVDSLISSFKNEEIENSAMNLHQL